MNTDALTILRMLAKGRSAPFTAAAVGLTAEDVRELADSHGACRRDGSIDTTAAAKAADALARDATPAIPVRAVPDPAPAAKLHGGSGDATLLTVPLNRVYPDPDNPREDVGDISGLIASLLEVGMLQPIVARRAGARFVIVAGHRRYAAARGAGWSHVPVIVRQEMRPDEVLAAMLVENGHRQDLDPIEEARGLARLKGQLGCNGTQLARRIGRHQTHVSGRLRLLALSIEEQEKIRRGETTLTEARDRARITSGRIGAQTGRPSLNHFSTVHPLAAAAKARCLRLKHDRGRGKGVGGIACGACWESVIRADERAHLHEQSGGGRPGRQRPVAQDAGASLTAAATKRSTA